MLPAQPSFLVVYTRALPPPTLRGMQRLFPPDAAFWEEHSELWRDQGYFSYLWPLFFTDAYGTTTSSLWLNVGVGSMSSPSSGSRRVREGP